MATRKTKAEPSSAATPAAAAPARRTRTTGATHKTAAPKTPKSAPAVVVNHEEQIAVPVTPDEIARLAYSYWEARGRVGGSQAEDWFRAEQELRLRAMTARG